MKIHEVLIIIIVTIIIATTLTIYPIKISEKTQEQLLGTQEIITNITLLQYEYSGIYITKTIINTTTKTLYIEKYIVLDLTKTYKITYYTYNNKITKIEQQTTTPTTPTTQTTNFIPNPNDNRTIPEQYNEYTQQITTSNQKLIYETIKLTVGILLIIISTKEIIKMIKNHRRTKKWNITQTIYTT